MPVLSKKQSFPAGWCRTTFSTTWCWGKGELWLLSLSLAGHKGSKAQTCPRAHVLRRLEWGKEFLAHGCCWPEEQCKTAIAQARLWIFVFHPHLWNWGGFFSIGQTDSWQPAFSSYCLKQPIPDLPPGAGNVAVTINVYCISIMSYQ